MMLFALTHLPHKVDFATSPLGCPHSSVGKESACNAGDLVQLLGQEDLLEKG